MKKMRREYLGAVVIGIIIIAIGMVIYTQWNEIKKASLDLQFAPPLEATEESYDLISEAEAEFFDTSSCASDSKCNSHFDCGLVDVVLDQNGNEVPVPRDANKNGIYEITIQINGEETNIDQYCLPTFGPSVSRGIDPSTSEKLPCVCQILCNANHIDPQTGKTGSPLFCPSVLQQPTFCNMRSTTDSDGNTVVVEAFCNNNPKYSAVNPTPSEELGLDEINPCGCFTFEENDDAINPNAAQPEFVPPDFEHIVAYENGAHIFYIKNINSNVPVKFYNFQLIDENGIVYELNDLIFNPTDLLSVNSPLLGTNMLRVSIDLFAALTAFGLPSGIYQIQVTLFQNDETENPDQNKAKKKVEIEKKEIEASVPCGCESAELRIKNGMHQPNTPLPQLTSRFLIHERLSLGIPSLYLVHLTPEIAKKRGIGFRYGVRGDAPVTMQTILFNNVPYSYLSNALIGTTFEIRGEVIAGDGLLEPECEYHTAQIIKSYARDKFDFNRDGTIDQTVITMTEPRKAVDGSYLPNPIPGIKAATNSYTSLSTDADYSGPIPPSESRPPLWTNDNYNMRDSSPILTVIDEIEDDQKLSVVWTDTPHMTFDPAIFTSRTGEGDFLARIGPGINSDVRLDSRHAWIDRSDNPNNQIPNYNWIPEDDEGICQCAFKIKLTYTNNPSLYGTPLSPVLIPMVTDILYGGTASSKYTFDYGRSVNCVPVER